MMQEYRYTPRYADVEFLKKFGQWTESGAIPRWVEERQDHMDVSALMLCAAEQEILALRQDLDEAVDANAEEMLLEDELAQEVEELGLTVEAPEEGQLENPLVRAFVEEVRRLRKESSPESQ